MLRSTSLLLFVGLRAPAADAQPDPTESRPCVEAFALEEVDRRPGVLQGTEPGAAADSVALVDSLETSAAPPTPTDTTLQSRSPRSPLALRGQGRPNPIQAVWQGAKNLGSDVVYLYSAPVRMSLSNVVALGAVAGTGAALYAFDEDIQSGFQRSREDPVYDAVVIKTGDFFEPLGLISDTHIWLEGAALAGWVLDVPLLRTIPVEILESNFIVGSIRQPIERIVHRRRPSEGGGARNFSGGSSFPSGHASVVWETAAILSHHFRHPLARAAFWGMATVVCLQRVDEPGHNHWPSDVWFGAALGAYEGHTIAARNEERRQGVPQGKWYDITHRPPPKWGVVPVVGPEYSGFALRATF